MEQPYAADMYVNEEPPKKGKERNAVLYVFSFLAGIFLFLSLLILLLLQTLRGWVAGGHWESMLQELDIGSVKLVVGENKESKTVSELIFENINEDMIEKYNLSKDSIDEILALPDMKDFVKDTCMDCVDYISGNTDQLQINPNEVIGCIQNNEDTIEELTGYRFVKEDYEELENKLTEYKVDQISSDQIQESYPAIEQIRRFFSYGDRIIQIIAGIGLFFALIQLLIFRKFFFAAFGAVGICSLLAGGAGYAFAFLTGKIKEFVLQNSYLPVDIAEPMFSSFSDILHSKAMPFIYIGIGLVFCSIFLRFFWGLRKK